MKLRLIGDIHANHQIYLDAIKGADYSIQLGDLSHHYKWLSEANVDPSRHRFFGGNHDGYNFINESPHNLGDFGPIDFVPELKLKIFFVRGAWSIDRKYRSEGYDWWPQEELTHEQCNQAIEAYKEYKPDILLSHEGPLHLLDKITNPEFAIRMGFSEPNIKTRTNQMLDAMLELYRPKLHFMGHYHKDFDQETNGTRYICLTCDSYFYPNLKQRYYDLEL